METFSLFHFVNVRTHGGLHIQNQVVGLPQLFRKGDSKSGWTTKKKFDPIHEDIEP